MIANGWRLFYYRAFKAALDELEAEGIGRLVKDVKTF